MTWDVEYDDGEIEQGLCTECVRKFVPYRKGEKVDWRDENNVYLPGHIVAVHDTDEVYDASYDVKVNGVVKKNQYSNNLRRSIDVSELLRVGSRVLSRYPGEDVPFAGEIASINEDGSFAVQFDDGDYLDAVHPADIRPAQHGDY